MCHWLGQCGRSVLGRGSEGAAGRWHVWIETALIFLVFFLHAAWPVPDVNEAHYLGKAIHYWNPAWVGGDFFLESSDTHAVFYFTFGWLSLWLGPTALAWTGRVLTWTLLAWAWRRLSFAVLARPWWSVLTAALTVLLIEHGSVAGEWIVGGVEAKGFAFVFVFLGIEALVRDRWNRAWLFFGLAAMFHVLVGGWAAGVAGVAWVSLGTKRRPPLRAVWPGLLGGFVLSLPALIPTLRLNWGVDPNIVDQANRIYVFIRLSHHLNPLDSQGFPSVSALPFVALFLVWLCLRWLTQRDAPAWRLHAYVLGTVAIAAVGALLARALSAHTDWAAAVLRYYWFRSADVAVPFGVALAGPALIERIWRTRPAIARAAAVVVSLAAAVYLGDCAIQRMTSVEPRSYRLAEGQFPHWREACRWVATSGQIPPDARFLTPQFNQTFKWYSGRSEVVNWKDFPQDPASIVEWWRRQDVIHATGSDDPLNRWHVSLAEQGVSRLRRLGRCFQADYVLTESDPPLDLPLLYRNEAFAVYRIE